MRLQIIPYFMKIGKQRFPTCMKKIHRQCLLCLLCLQFVTFQKMMGLQKVSNAKYGFFMS